MTGFPGGTLRAGRRRLLAGASSLAAVALALAWAPAGAAADAAEPEEPVIRMEPVFVEAASANPWQYFRVPGFEVISHCPDDFNQVYARALRASTAAREALLPPDFWGRPSTPMKIVLYNREPAAVGDLTKVKPIDLSWIAGEDVPPGSYAAMRSHPTVVGDGDTFINCGNYRNLLSSTEGFYVDPDSEILLRCRVPQLPGWFMAGLLGPGGVLATHTLEPSAGGGRAAVFPSLTWVSKAETAALVKDPLRPRTVMPLREFFGRKVPEGDRAAWDAEAALLARWGLLGAGPEGRPHRDGFLDLARAACREPVTEALFRGCLGMGYAEAEEQLRAYVGLAVRGPVRLPLLLPPEAPVDIREAEPSEVARIVGDWGRLEGRAVGLQNLDFQRECLEQADRLFERIYARQSGDAQFMAAFGLYALQVGDLKRGREALESATGSGVVRARAYLELARLRLGDSLPYEEQGLGDLVPKDYEQIVRLLATAREQMPALVGSYLLLARAIEHGPGNPSAADLEVLDQAVGLFPRNASLAYTVATLYKRLGHPAKAEAVIARALPVAETDEDRARLAAFVARDS
jgi:hypothetical protein